MEDLFDKFDELPEEVIEVIDNFTNGKDDGELEIYLLCGILVEELNEIGYTCDYELDAEPFNLRKL